MQEAEPSLHLPSTLSPTPSELAEPSLHLPTTLSPTTSEVAEPSVHLPTTLSPSSPWPESSVHLPTTLSPETDLGGSVDWGAYDDMPESVEAECSVGDGDQSVAWVDDLLQVSHF